MGRESRSTKERFKGVACPHRHAGVDQFTALDPLSARASRHKNGRLRRLGYAELAACEKFDLSLSWLCRDGATDPPTLPPPGEIATSIAEDLEAALSRCRAVAAQLG